MINKKFLTRVFNAYQNFVMAIIYVFDKFYIITLEKFHMEHMPIIRQSRTFQQFVTIFCSKSQISLQNTTMSIKSTIALLNLQEIFIHMNSYNLGLNVCSYAWIFVLTNGYYFSQHM